MLTYDEKEYLEMMTPEEKYRLYNECEFILSNNFAKLNYISEKGFGKALLRFINGKNKRARRKIFKNTVELQEKMKNIIVCLDDETFVLRQEMKYLFKSSQEISDFLLSQNEDFMSMTVILEELVGRMGYTADYLAEKFPDYKSWDKSFINAELNKIKESISVRIHALNKSDEEYFSIEQPRVEKEEARINKAKSARILRLTPFEETVITGKGIEDITPVKGQHKWEYWVEPSSVKDRLKNKNCNIAVLPEAQWNDFPGVTVIRPADYFMYLWFLNTPQNERKGRTVGIIDMYRERFYVYRFEVSRDGNSYSRINILENNMSWDHRTSTIRDRLKYMFGDSYSSTLFYRTFVTRNQGLEDRINDTKYYNIGIVKPIWEHRFYANEEELISFVHNIIEPVYDDEEQIAPHCDPLRY